jgi:hypothetical protein
VCTGPPPSAPHPPRPAPAAKRAPKPQLDQGRAPRDFLLRGGPSASTLQQKLEDLNKAAVQARVCVWKVVVCVCGGAHVSRE